MNSSTALTCAVVLALVAIGAILLDAPDWVIAGLLGLFGLAGFLALSTAGDFEDVGEAE